ncbi:MAG: thioredoxin family protein [Phycisphaeraceae bacterium]
MNRLSATMSSRLFMIALASLLLASPAFGQVKSKYKWLTSMRPAELQAKKSEKPILIYFCGSDWDDYTKELDEICLEYDYFHNWAKENVILVKVDFMAKGNQSKFQKQENTELKERFQITKVPTFVAIDKDGNVIGRCGYTQAKLRKDEKKGVPYAFLQHLDAILAGKAPPEEIEKIEGVDAGLAASKESGLPLLLVCYNPKSQLYTEHVNKFLAQGPVVRFINTSMVVTHAYLPDDEDKSAEAEKTRKWFKDHKISTGQATTLAVWDPVEDKVTGRLFTFNIAQPQPTLNALEKFLPQIEYKGEWITSYRKARAIAAQSRRSVVIAFTRYDDSPYCKQLRTEVFDTTTFKDYARYNLVLLAVDFSKDELKDEKVKKDRNELGDQYGIRGFPTVVVLNAAGHKIATSGLIKGGPDTFLQQLKAVRDKDLARHDHPSQW